MRQPILRLITLMMLGWFAYHDSFALPFFGTSPSPATNNATNPSRIMSGDEFSNRVKALNQQTQSQLSEQTNAVLPKQPAAPLIVPNSAKAAPAAAPNMAQPLPPPAAAMTAPPANPNTAATFPLPNNTVRAQPSAPVQQNQTYSGFGTGNTNRPATNSPSSNAGGWNIKY